MNNRSGSLPISPYASHNYSWNNIFKSFSRIAIGDLLIALDENIKKIIMYYVARWKTTRVNRDRLLELRDEIVKKTGFSSLPLTTLKKWVRKTVRETAQAEKLKTLAYAPAMPIAAPISEKAFLQFLSFDIAAMRKSLEKIANRLTEIERELALKKK